MIDSNVKSTAGVVVKYSIIMDHVQTDVYQCSMPFAGVWRFISLGPVAFVVYSHKSRSQKAVGISLSAVHLLAMVCLYPAKCKDKTGMWGSM